jgi:hypothetical protein
MDDQAQPYVEYVSISDDDIAKYGEIITQVTAFGCTSRGQANRLGKWILYSEKYEGETVAFKTGLEGTPVRPGDIIKIADPVRAGLRLGGRINAATAYSITVDSLLVDGNGNAVNPVGGTLSVIATDGSVQQSTVTDTIAGTAISIFSRASIGTYIDSTGILRTAAANVPRLDYSTGTEAVLIEAAATNYNTAPNSVSVAYGSPVIASNAVTAPDGTMTATRIMFSGSSGAIGHIADASFPLPGPGTISLWLRADVACQQHLYFSTHNSSGTQVIQSNFLINLTTSWKRFSISASAIPAGYTKIQWQINEVTATNIYVWGGQTEAATSSSSFIPTVGSVASRAADVATMSLSASQTLVLSAPFAVTPQAQAMWILELPTIEGQLFRIIQSTRNERNEFTITAMAYNASKYGYIDYGTALVQQQITDLTQPLSAPASLECTESLYSYQGTIFSMASLGWAAVAGATAYLVGWAKDSSNMNFATVPNNQFDLSKTDPGLYLFQVWTIGPNQRQSTKCVSLTQQLYGKTLPPSDVVGLTYGWDQNNGLVLSWAQARDVDLYAYEIRAGQNWADATVLGQSKTTTFIVGTKFADQTFWVAVLDTQGVYSVNPQSVSPVLPSISAPKVAAEFVGVDAVISWAAPTSILAIDHYIISLDGGLSALAMVSGTTFSRKAIFSGTNIYSVAAVDIAGNVGAFGSASLTMVLPAVNSITDQVVDNNVLLYWKVAAGTLPIDHYIVAEGYSWATAQMLGQTSGTFDTIFETAAGLKSYWICAVDAAGNRGVPANLSVYVNPPPDYVLHYNLNSTFGGNRTNIATDTNGTLIAPVDTVTTYQAHFANKSWSSPNDQVNAGFPLFIEPALLSASYVETIDYGSILPASSVLVTLSSAVISGAPVVSCTIAVSADNSTWTTYANTTSVYVSNFRYARITISVSGTAGLDILQINALNIKYQVKQKTDSGTITCNFGDSNGTPVQFNMSFIDVTSISVTPNSTTPCFAIYNFSGDADPTGFTIMLFDTSGNRISGSVSWSARGV